MTRSFSWMLLGIAGLTACAGGSSAPEATPAAAGSGVDAALIAQTWQVKMASDAARAPFEGRSAWVAYFEGRRAEALAAMPSDGDATAQARMHAEYAAVYRQAALLASNATLHVYGTDAQPTDPKEVSYLVGVAGALTGDASARAKLGAASGSAVASLAAQDKAWKAWADAGAAWPPDAPAATSPGAPAGATALQAGQLPDAGPLPHYQLPEAEGGLTINAGDPGTLWALSRQHEALALSLDAPHKDAIAALIDPWRLPPEAPSGQISGDVPDALLFMSLYSTASDIGFLAAIRKDGAAAVDAWKTKSPYAAVIAGCQAPSLTLDCLLERSLALSQEVEAGMNKAAGHDLDFSRGFASFVRVGALIAAERVAASLAPAGAPAEDPMRELSGKLKINALDRSIAPARDPLFLLSVAAWDAGNRNSLRAGDLVHELLAGVPGLEAARLPLDALHIRLSRNAAPGRAVH